MLENLTDFDPNTDRVADRDLEEVDLYMYHRLQKLIENARAGYDKYDFSAVYHAVHDYCAVDLSSFYMDFAKDILYIEAGDNNRRRSIQTVYYATLVTLVQLIAPIIPHTAEEVWEFIPGTKAEYVQLTDIPESVTVYDDVATQEKWEQFMAIRNDVLKALEEARDEKIIGKSLEAQVTIVPHNKEEFRSRMPSSA